MSMRPGSLQRGIAVFFLVFTLVDIVFIDLLGQQGCTEEASALPSESMTSIQENEAYGMAFVNDTPLPLDPNTEGEVDEDCFCCCSHLIPGIRPDMAVLNGSPQPGNPAILFFPSSPSRGTFHPPRLS